MAALLIAEAAARFGRWRRSCRRWSDERPTAHMEDFKFSMLPVNARARRGRIRRGSEERGERWIEALAG